MNKKQREQYLSRFNYRCRGARTKKGDELVRTALAAGNEAAAREADEAHRKECGTDLTGVIASAPFDGKEHEGECPGCGRTVRWTAATQDGVDEVLAGEAATADAE